MKQGSVTSARGTTYYWISRCEIAEAKTLVFTHGLTADHRMFAPQVEHFRDRYHLILWDVPLHGLSRPYSDFSYANTAEELAAVLDAESVVSAVLVGMSMGGYPSQEFAERYPERVEGFVALDTTPFGDGYYSRFDLWCLRWATAMTRWMPDSMIRRMIIEGNARSDGGRNILRAILKDSTKEQICEQMEAAYGVFAHENHNITMTFPVLILLGEHDKTGKVKTYCENWARNTEWPLVVIPDAAHMSNIDNARAVNHAIDDFLNIL